MEVREVRRFVIPSRSRPQTPGETWQGVDRALRRGQRGLPGGNSLSGLLTRRCGAGTPQALPALTVEKVLAWADRHNEQTGRWPSVRPEEVLDAPGETWRGINHALARGYRGLPGGSSLAQRLAVERGKPCVRGAPL